MRFISGQHAPSCSALTLKDTVRSFLRRSHAARSVRLRQTIARLASLPDLIQIDHLRAALRLSAYEFRSGSNVARLGQLNAVNITATLKRQDDVTSVHATA